MSDRRDNANGPALAINGEERASADQYPAEHDSNLLHIKEHFARSGDATRRSSEGLHEHLEQRAIDIHEPFFFSHDATSGQQELERLPAGVERHAVENDDDPLQSPKKEPAQPAVEEDFAISQDAAFLTSEDFRKHLERRARDASSDQQELELAASVRVEHHAVENNDGPPKSPKKEPSQLAGEGDFAASEDAAPHAPEDSREHLKRRAAVHEPSVFSRDANGNQQDFERLIASIHAVQREEAAARLPKAAQLASVPDLATVGDGIWPHYSLEPDYLRRDALRGPRTMIKLSFLIVGILSVPIAYYFWMGGWHTIPGASSPEVASFNSKPIIPPPKSSSEEETGERAAQRDAQTPIPAPRPTATTDRTAMEAQTPIPAAAAASPTATTDRTAVEAQTSIPAPAAASPTATTDRTAVEAQTPIPAAASPTATTDRTAVEAQTSIPAPAAASPTATTGRTAVAPVSEQNVTSSDQSDADEVVVLLKRGQELMHHGDLAAARLVLRHAADAKNAEAALILGSTYDPVILRELRVYGLSADVGMARTWYEKAKDLGSPEAVRRLDNLGH
jgi:hypothetical protein